MANEQEEPSIPSLEIPSDGKVLLPHIVDSLAKTKPHQIHAEYPVSSLSYDDGYRQITYSDLANAVNGVAWWLHKTLGPGKFEKLAYIGPNDLRYPVLVLGAVKAGYVIFLPSPRNSVVAQLSLLEKLDCKIMLSTTPQVPPTTAILEAIKLQVLEVPTVEELLDIKYPHFSYDKTYEEAFLEPLFAVHTSGSTGLPKPVVYTHETGARNMSMMMLDPPEGFESQTRIYEGKRVFITFPPFHGAFLDIYLFNAIPFETVMIFPTSVPVSAVGVVQGLKKTAADIAFIVPSIVQELAQDPKLLDYCVQNLETIVYSGGDLPQSIGDTVASKIRLINLYGSLELGIIALLQPREWEPEDWKYVTFHPHLGVELRYTSDDVYALYIVHSSAEKTRQPTLSLFPNTEEFSTRDLFVRHPEKPDLWKWYARADDIISFLNGEKTNPISMEQHIATRNPDTIRTALVMGTHHVQAALLIDPIHPLELDVGEEENSLGRSRAEEDLIETIWPSVEEANQDCPAHARITKSHIFFTRPDKKVLIAGKGTVQRAGTLALYQDELEALYNSEIFSYEDGELDGDSAIDVSDDAGVAEVVRKIILSATGWKDIDDQDDFFTRGMDSLHTLVITRQLRRSFAMPEIMIGAIYKSPSICQLSSAIHQLLLQGQLSPRSSSNSRYRIRHQIFEEYRGRIDEIANRQASGFSGPVSEETGGQIVILTGSTGALGSYVLDNLLSNPEIEHIYCLNRSPQSLQVKRNLARSLPIEFPTSKVTFLTCDLSTPNLGLPYDLYEKLLQTVTLIIHNAWPVNFNLSLPSFKPHIQGLVNLIELASSRVDKNVRLLFISSIASVMHYQSPSSMTLEAVIEDDTAPGTHGYAESKYISELLLNYAGEKLGVDVAFARVGQIAGAVNSKGCWIRDEWFPSLVISSLLLGVFPRYLGPMMGVIDWIPVDLLAGIVTELALGQWSEDNEIPSVEEDADVSWLADSSPPMSSPSVPPRKVQVFHPLNPHATTWDVVCPIFIDTLSKITGKDLETMDSDVWLEKVQNDMEIRTGKALEEEELEAYLRRNPAFKLLDFYNDVMRSSRESANDLDRVKTLLSSEKLRGLEGVNIEWISKWADQIYSLV